MAHRKACIPICLTAFLAMTACQTTRFESESAEAHFDRGTEYLGAGDYSPAIYASGPDASRLAALNRHGLDVRTMDGPVGQASALKMCYAGLTKGLHAVGVSVIRGAIEAGIEDVFFAELAASQPMLLDYFTRRTPGIFVKAYRWVAEMQEIGDFLGGPSGAIYDGAAALFDGMAADHAGSRRREAELLAFLKGERGGIED